MALTKEDNKKNRQLIVGGVIVTLVVSTWVWAETRKNSYAVYVNDQVVATMKDKEEVKKAYESVVSNLKEKLKKDIVVNETIEVEAVHSKTSERQSYNETVAAISNAISYDVEAYEILVDGVSYAVVSHQEEATEVLSAIAKEHLPSEGQLTLEEVTISEESVSTDSRRATKDAELEIIEVEEALPHDKVTTKISVDEIQVEELDAQVSKEGEGQKIKRTIQNFDFNEEVTVRNIYVSQDEILTQEEAEEKLLENRYEIMDYELKAGDNIWDIAMTYGTTMERTLELNPNIEDETRMQIGEVIKVEQSLPILSITTVEEATFKELIPADIEYIEFSDLYKDETKVYQEGYDGLKELTVSVTKVNGVEIGRTLISEKVLSEAKTKVIAYGTKEKPTSSGSYSTSNNRKNTSSSSSGMFMHPLKGRGSLSSGYGSRWGSFHKGIDIAAPAGTPVYAAAGGKVIYSGYNSGGYGKLIIIEHSNGYQTYYAHNSQLYVNVGETVAKGERIAGVGSTGDSTGNHVHFEIRRNGTPVNPSQYI